MNQQLKAHAKCRVCGNPWSKKETLVTEGIRAFVCERCWRDSDSYLFCVETTPEQRPKVAPKSKVSKIVPQPISEDLPNSDEIFQKLCPVCNLHFDALNSLWNNPRSRWCNMCITLRKYGLNRRTYEAMHSVQGGACFICGVPGKLYPARRGDWLVVDHCHATGKVRGLLCTSCNSSLGLMKDNPERLRKAALYLERII